MDQRLTKEQLEFYQTNGYLVLRLEEHRLVADPAYLKAWAEQVRNWPLETGKWMPYFETTASGAKQPMRTENFVDYHDQWKDLICGSDMANVLKQLAGEVSESVTQGIALLLLQATQVNMDLVIIRT